MSDIVKRLRRPTADGDAQRAEAADEIERLKADETAHIELLADNLMKRDIEIERLRAALEQIAALDVHHKLDTEWTDVGEIARAVLEPKP